MRRRGRASQSGQPPTRTEHQRSERHAHQMRLDWLARRRFLVKAVFTTCTTTSVWKGVFCKPSIYNGYNDTEKNRSLLQIE